MILPDSGATMTLIHSRIVRRLGLQINTKGGEIYDLYNAHWKSMAVDGTCVIHMFPEGCSKPRTLKCLITPSLEEEEVLLECGDMVAWGILKKDFHILSDEVLPDAQSTDVRKSTAKVNPTTSSAIGGVGADNSDHSSDGTIGKGLFEDQDVEKRLEGVRNRLLARYDDIFTDKLGESDRMRGDPVQLEIKSNAATPYHCWTPAEVSANHEKEARRMVQSMVEAGIIEEVNRSNEWCSRFFCGKALD